MLQDIARTITMPMVRRPLMALRHSILVFSNLTTVERGLSTAHPVHTKTAALPTNRGRVRDIDDLVAMRHHIVPPDGSQTVTKGRRPDRFRLEFYAERAMHLVSSMMQAA